MHSCSLHSSLLNSHEHASHGVNACPPRHAWQSWRAPNQPENCGCAFLLHPGSSIPVTGQRTEGLLLLRCMMLPSGGADLGLVEGASDSEWSTCARCGEDGLMSSRKTDVCSLLSAWRSTSGSMRPDHGVQCGHVTPHGRAHT